MPVSSKLSHELLKSILIIYFIITFIVTIGHLAVEYSYTKYRIKQELIGISKTFEPILRAALWDLNEDQVKAISEGIMHIDIVYGITITDPNGNIMANNINTEYDNAIHEHKDIIYSFPIYHKYKDHDLYLANVEIQSNKHAVFERVKINFMMIFINAIIKSTALILLFIIAFEKHLGEPLKVLTEKISQFSWHNKEGRIINIAFRKHNEFSILLDKFNKLLKKISEEEDKHLKLSQKYTQELEKKVERRTKELESLNKQLLSLAETDTLTFLNNRSKLEKELKSNYENFKRYKRPFSVILLDIDNFKKINDTYGHDMGDKVLVKVAQILKTHTRKTDVVGRWGGEEFLIICSETNIDEAYHLAETLREFINRDEFKPVGHISASFGISEIYNMHTIFDLVKEADQALYHAKASGKNRSIKYSKALDYANK